MTRLATAIYDPRAEIIATKDRMLAAFALAYFAGVLSAWAFVQIVAGRLNG